MERFENCGVLCHLVITAKEATEPRRDWTDPCERLQVASIVGHKLQEFPAHRHIAAERGDDTCYPACEAWVVVRGSVLVTLYGVDHSELGYRRLGPGDVVVTFFGGHKFTMMEEGTMVWEFKTGPYVGRERDKVML